MTALEEEMAKLLSAAGEVKDSGNRVKADAGKMRRKSKDLEDQLNDIAQPSDQWAQFGRRSRRGSRDYSDEGLRKSFDEYDKSKDGQLDSAELLQAIKDFDPNIDPETINGMMDFADRNKDGMISFEEFKKVMLFKPQPVSQE